MANKVRIDKVGEAQFVKSPENLQDSSKKVHFKTIQISQHDPSNFTIVIDRKGANGAYKREIELVDFRNQFKYQNGKYILDVSDIPKFQEDGWFSRVEISLQSIEQFQNIDAEIYFSMVDKDVVLNNKMVY